MQKIISLMSNRIGIMQGRLSPAIDGKIQDFPSKTWKEEFQLAQEIGFEVIEWVIVADSLDKNPVFNISGRKEIKSLQAEFNIDVQSVCCDCFMDMPLNSSEKAIREKAKSILLDLINVSPELRIKFIEIPLVGNAEIKTEGDKLLLKELFQEIIPILEKLDLFILLELSLNPFGINDFLTDINSKRILINYDTGNSAYWGYKPNEEIPLYGKYIANVHIKDCTPRDYTVPLGTGNVDFNYVFKLLKDASYNGDFILQAARGKNDYLTAENFYKFTKLLTDQYFNGYKLI